jgi:hypothetical protein
MSETTAALTLPSGMWHGEDYLRHVTVRSLCGQDELFWLDLPDRWSLPQRVSALLERVVGWNAAPLPDGIAGGLTIECVLNCPQCGEKLDLDLSVDDLLLPPYDQPQPEYEAQFGDGYRVCFRLPTGADQMHIAGLAQVDLDAAEQALIDRCVLAVRHQDRPLERLPKSLNADLADCMAQLDSQAELSIRMACPICGTDFATLLDMAQFLTAEIANHSRLLNREIHALALYYHWSETEILHLPVQRRQTYLRLLDESFGGGQLA